MVGKMTTCKRSTNQKVLFWVLMDFYFAMRIWDSSQKTEAIKLSRQRTSHPWLLNTLVVSKYVFELHSSTIKIISEAHLFEVPEDNHILNGESPCPPSLSPARPHLNMLGILMRYLLTCCHLMGSWSVRPFISFAVYPWTLCFSGICRSSSFSNQMSAQHGNLIPTMSYLS